MRGWIDDVCADAVALARLAPAGWAVVSVARPLALAERPDACWAQADPGQRFLIEDDASWLVAEGAAWSFAADGPGRFALAGAAYADAAARCVVRASAPGAPHGPLVLLAASFEDAPPGPSHWGEHLPGLRLHLPQRLWLRAAQGGWEVLSAKVTRDDDPVLVAATLGRPGRTPAVERSTAPAWPKLLDDYPAQVEDAVALIADGAMRKVVLARAVDEVVEGGIDAVLGRLGDRRTLGAVRYGVDLAHGGCFLGNTPESLIGADDGSVRAMALAGTCPVGESDGATLAAVAELLSSTKQRKEHGLVVEHLAAVLRPRLDALTIPGTPHQRQVGGMVHLETLVSGSVRQRNWLELAGALHPTPAVCGLPVATASHWIRRHEHLHRGLYAGVLGWLSPNACRLSVPLRGAVLDAGGGRARLFAGAGIVETSDPQAELAETELKLAAMRAVLGA